MEKNNIKKQNVYVSEEEKTLNWQDIQNSFKKPLATKFIIVGYKNWFY